MIPKIIHYCWFGRGQMPELVQNCVSSWSKYLPDYDIQLWNEDNFDIRRNRYAAEAHKERKFAFVADVCRLHVLKNVGGIYLDTDVQFIKRFPEEFLNRTAFTAFEDNLMAAGIVGSVQSGKWVSELLANYNNKSFYLADGNLDLTPITEMMTYFMRCKVGLKANNLYQNFKDYCTIYPSEYFYPKSWKTSKVNITANTYCIHHFAGSWIDRKITPLGRFANFVLGKRIARICSMKYRELKRRYL